VRMLLQPAVNQALSQFSSRLPSWLAILVFGNLNNMK
jgi:hypothetical protein